MQTFTLDPRRWWIGRLWARNPLLRLGDRIEVLAVLAALMVSLLGIAVAGAVGTEIHDAERRADAELARTRQSVSATVVDVGTVTNFDGSQKAMVQARWAAGNDAHTDSFQWGTKVQPGDRIQIWVDNRGDYVDLPRPLRPVLDACTVAISIVLLVVSMLAGALALLRWRLERGRDARWDREIRSLASEDGGRANGATPGKSP